MEQQKKTIKERIEDRAREVRQTMAFQAQGQFIAKVQKWEKCTWDEAVELCSGKSPERHPEYILGYKMADPVLMEAMYLQVPRKNRESARMYFRETLDPDCLEIFDRDCQKLGDLYRKEHKRQARRI